MRSLAKKNGFLISTKPYVSLFRPPVEYLAEMLESKLEGVSTTIDEGMVGTTSVALLRPAGSKTGKQKKKKTKRTAAKGASAAKSKLATIVGADESAGLWREGTDKTHVRVKVGKGREAYHQAARLIKSLKALDGCEGSRYYTSEVGTVVEVVVVQ